MSPADRVMVKENNIHQYQSAEISLRVCDEKPTRKENYAHVPQRRVAA